MNAETMRRAVRYRLEQREYKERGESPPVDLVKELECFLVEARLKQLLHQFLNPPAETFWEKVWREMKEIFHRFDLWLTNLLRDYGPTIIREACSVLIWMLIRKVVPSAPVQPVYTLKVHKTSLGHGLSRIPAAHLPVVAS